MNYPELYIPKTIIELSDKEFPKPIQPIRPDRPLHKNKWKQKSLILCLAIFFIIINWRIWWVTLIVSISVYCILQNIDKIKFQEKSKKYRQELIEFWKLNDLYKKEKILYNSLDISNYNKNCRLKELSEILRFSTVASNSKDYKKGYSHFFFKTHLCKNFDNIQEDLCIKQSSHNGESNYNPYIVDFAIIDSISGLSIDIEIDEPYTITEKKPIHLDDKLRNDFFNKHGWIVLRFAEEQIVLYPHKCCEYIKHVIDCINRCDISEINVHEIPSIKKWTLETVNTLIDSDHRKSYLKKLNDSTSDYIF